ncbi:MAG: SUF system NifU family Fe-S cluster assembly protein [Anaerolinea sp.]|nr:SUF system NifU family Fe-S cluster assembly protein [Anaerolinea sp.]
MTAPEPQFDDFYRELILDHFRRPRNRGELADPTHRLEGVNPVCGDEIQLDLLIKAGQIDDIAFTGSGCSISQCSASMLTERLKGRSVAEAAKVLSGVRAMLIEGTPPGPDLGDLESLEGVARLPVRVKCALLSWNVLQDGLNSAAGA